MQSLGDSGGVDFPLGAEDELHAGLGRIAEMRLAVGVGSGVGGVIANRIKAKIVESLNNFSDIGIFSVGVVDMRINSKRTNNTVYSNGLSHRFFSQFMRELAMGIYPQLLSMIRFNTRQGPTQCCPLTMIYCLECGPFRWPARRAAAFGAKFLKQWTRTMRLIKPQLFLTEEDYSDWSAMTGPSLTGDGLGFDATWYGDFHYNLVERHGGAQAQLLRNAGFGDKRALTMSSLAGALQTSARSKVIYNQSHDDCGNREVSARTAVIAVNFAPLSARPGRGRRRAPGLRRR
nr:hypothetical protein [Rhizobium leguminosarum]